MSHILNYLRFVDLSQCVHYKNIVIFIDTLTLSR